jgi:hypothetical protein
MAITGFGLSKNHSTIHAPHQHNTNIIIKSTSYTTNQHHSSHGYIEPLASRSNCKKELIKGKGGVDQLNKEA